MSWAGLDQRAFPRVSAKCDIWIGDRPQNTIKTKTQNLGAGGACVILDRQIEKLSRVHLRLTLKEIITPIECDGRVVWMVRTKEPVSGKVTFDAGLEFLNLTTEAQERISSFAQQYSQAQYGS